MPKAKQELPCKTTIRAVTRARDIEPVATLARKIWRAHYVPIIGAEQTEYMLKKFQSTPAIKQQIADGYEYYLLLTGTKRAGYFAIAADPTSHSALLSKIYVTQKCRGKGFGKAMLLFAERRCLDLGIRRICLTVNRHNTQSIAFYQHSGFRNTGKIVQDIGNGFVMDDYRMEKIL